VDITLVLFVRMLIFGAISECVKDMRWNICATSGRQQHGKIWCFADRAS